MRKINKDSEEIDLFVDPRELTKDEQTLISNFIKLDKQKKKGRKKQPKPRVSL